MMTRVAPLRPMALRTSVRISRALSSFQSCSTCIKARCFRLGAVSAGNMQFQIQVVDPPLSSQTHPYCPWPLGWFLHHKGHEMSHGGPVSKASSTEQV